MNEDLRIMRQVALKADAFYEDASRLGTLAARCLTDKKRSQITGLESICNSSMKVSDPCDFIKVRTARHKEWQKENLGEQVLEFIEKTIAKYRGEVCAVLSITDEREKQEIYLMLIREFVRQMAAQYEYAMTKSPGG
jgi:hypothetical protein